MPWRNLPEEGSVDTGGVREKIAPFGQLGPNVVVAVLEDNVGV